MKKLFKSFTYAGKGIFWCLKNERNMRAHFSLCVYMYAYLLGFRFFHLTKTEWAIILICNALVFSLEIVNTAIEKTVDLASKERTEFGRIAKDTAAGAVLMSALFSVVIGVIILYQPDAFRAMYEYYKERIYLLVVLVISLVLTFCFIIKGIPERKNK